MIDKVGVVGAGLMGAEIALVAALAGKQVLLSDTSDELLAKALENLGKVLDKGVQRGFYQEEQKSQALGRIAVTTDLVRFAAEEVDLACKLGLGHPVGPFELCDAVTNKLSLQVQEILQGAYGERFRPRPLLKHMVQAGYDGKKAGRGWYRYEGKTR